MEFNEVVKKRKMIREYDQNKAIPDYIIAKIIENAHRALGAGHTQVQEFIIVKDPSTKSKLAQAALRKIQVSNAPVWLILVKK